MLSLNFCPHSFYLTLSFPSKCFPAANHDTFPILTCKAPLSWFSASRSGRILFHWKWSSDLTLNVNRCGRKMAKQRVKEYNEINQVVEIRDMRSLGTSDHSKPLHMRASLGIRLALWLLYHSVVSKIQSFSLSLFQFILQEVDITLPENSAWYQRYKFDIPVFHLNGQFLMMHRVDISKLEKQLQKLEQQGLWSSTLSVQMASSWGHGLSHTLQTF